LKTHTQTQRRQARAQRREEKIFEEEEEKGRQKELVRGKSMMV